MAPPERGPAGAGLGHILIFMYFVYVLKSLKDNGFYIGQTDNVINRLHQHNKGHVISTKYRAPFILIREEQYTTRSEARVRENYLKKLKGGNEFKKIIKSS